MYNPLFDVEGKIVLITGSSRGLGLAYAKGYLEAGATVVMNATVEEKLRKAVEAFTKQGYRAYGYCFDVSDELQVNNAVDRIEKEVGPIDILINNAGIAIDTLFEDKTKDNFMKTLDINLIAPFLLCKKIGPKMVDNKYGLIINISSTNGIDTPYIESIDYDASKAGLISLSKNLANYFAPYVRVNTICPGWVNTEMNKNLDSDFISKEENKILLGRFANPREVANLVEFLISDKANYINDSIIRIDGGIKC